MASSRVACTHTPTSRRTTSTQTKYCTRSVRPVSTAPVDASVSHTASDASGSVLEAIHISDSHHIASSSRLKWTAARPW
jgi:hypothetical protein